VVWPNKRRQWTLSLSSVTYVLLVKCNSAKFCENICKTSNKRELTQSFRHKMFETTVTQALKRFRHASSSNLRARRTTIIRPRRCRIAVAYSDQTFLWMICWSVCQSVQCDAALFPNYFGQTLL